MKGLMFLISDGNILEGKKHIHFIGIGGSGMYPLAQILHAQGIFLTGSDNNNTDTIMAIQKMGVPVSLEQQAENIQGADLIVHTSAIMSDNPELIAAQNSGVPLIDRATLLGILTQQYDHAICISGTHGKTTASSMLTQIMLDGAYDPTVVIGGKLAALHGSGRVGQSKYMVCEACEYCDNFLTLSPDIAVILNIDEDHMEYFKTMDNMVASYTRFASMSTKAVIYYGDDAYSPRAVQQLHLPVLSFGMGDNHDYYPGNIQRHSGMHISFDLMFRQQKLTPIDMFVPGDQNILNALAACASAHQSEVPPDTIRNGIASFRGTQRRFETLLERNGITVVDDYAHHPAEIEATLNAAQSMGFQRVIAIHQPFTFSRTARFLNEFARVLQIADLAVLSEIMGSREKNTIGIHAKDLADKIPGSVWFRTFEEIAQHVVQMAKPGDLLITMGCGDVNKCAQLIKQKLLEQQLPT